MMKRIKLNFFDLDEISSREFDFSIFIIMLCIIFRNYFRGYGFAIHLNSDLLFEMTLLLLPVTLLFFNKKTNKEVANSFDNYLLLLSPLLGGLFFVALGVLCIHLAHLISFVDFIFSFIGLVFLIPGIINILIAVLVFSTKQLVKQSVSKK